MSGDVTGQITLLGLLRIKGVDWHVVAREAQRPGGLERLVAAEPLEASKQAEATAALIAIAKPEMERHHGDVAALIDSAVARGAGLVTVLDDAYPVNLRIVFNLPPFLFFRGELCEDDARAVAVVGTRTATDDGLHRARQMARLLAEQDVTVLSGLARGIDTAAHQACLDAGGRTIAVLGSGMFKVYPPENHDLAERITDRGAVVSQFWPDAPPTRYSFPRRNAVMSGMGQGTVVIEASATSGAKMQARLALEHGKKVWLLESLVTRYPWARKYLDRGATQVTGVDTIISQLRSAEAIRERADSRMQLALGV